MLLKDANIREELHTFVEDRFSYDQSTKIVDELQVCYGEARVDMAVINGYLHGYEIKSDRDTLERLPNQIEQYNKVFDYITLVCGEKYVNQSLELIPSWWGLYVAKSINESNVCITVLREPELNNQIDAFSLTQFLWKDQLIEILLNQGEPKQIKRFPKYKLWELASNKCSISDLQEQVKIFLKTKRWRVD